MSRIDAITCSSNCSRHSSSVTSASALTALVPALLTRMSTGPARPLGDPLGGVRGLHVDPVTARGAHDAGPLRLQHVRGGGADAAARPGHHRHPPLDPEIHGPQYRPAARSTEAP
jgi:hypothetical protein